MSIASRARWLARQETRDIENDRRARAIAHREPTPSGHGILTPPIKPKTAERRDADKRKRNKNWYPNPVKPKWLRSGHTVSFCDWTPMK